MREMIEELKEKLTEYRPIPFWSWNDKLEITELKRQINWMHNNGIDGFFMHARSGLMTEYLSADWMQCIEACAKEAKRHGMKAWVYDENGWPSGFAGGKLLEEEQNRDKYILYTIGTYDSEATVSYLLTEHEIQRVACGEKEGEYLNLYIKIAVSTADVLNPKVVEQFLTLTHESYQTYFGERFSEMIEGFFTDEPQYYRWNTPYTDVMVEYFQKKYGEDILDELGLLFVEKKGYRQFRYRYWKAMQSLLLHNFSEQVYQWCDSHGVKLTGHYIEETCLATQMWCCGGIMPFYEYEHIPGIDWLGRSVDNLLSPKQVGSVAAQLGKKRVLTESYACCGWDITPSELRRITAFQYANGVNMLCHHLLPYSERGCRKYDYPAHYSDVNPWVKEEFKEFNDYFTNLGCVLGEGEQHVNVAMLHPIRSAYFDYKRELEDAGFGIQPLEDALAEACRMLSSNGVEYHFLDETLLEKHGFVNGSQIGCGQCSYDYLVLPSIQTMDKTTENLLYQYVEQGGKVLILGDKPCYLEGQEYEYKYLQSNVTLNEIKQAQPYQVKYCEKAICSTYRTLNEKKYLYVMNSSTEESITQVFEFGEDIPPMEVTLKPGEDAFLQPTEPSDVEKTVLDIHTLKFKDALITVKENCLPIDMVSYSKDGQTYSEPWPYAALFQKLLYERYRGTIYFKYEFQIEDVPKQLTLCTEQSNDIAAWLNDNVLEETLSETESYVQNYDVTAYVKKGINTFVKKVDWYQKDMVFFALFGENVTESLRNCIVYDTELEPIELIGQFGVCPREGYIQDEDERYVRGANFYIGSLPQRVSEPSTEGFPFLAGEMTLAQNITLDSPAVLLRIEGDYPTAQVTVNGKYAGKLFFQKELDISHVAKEGVNKVEVRFLLSNRNRMGPHHRVGNKNAPVTPMTYQMFGEWKEKQCESYHSDYDIKKFYY